MLAFVFWQPIQTRFLEYLVMRNEDPAPTVLSEVADRLGNPTEFLLKLWRSPNLSNHQFVLDYLRQHPDSNPDLFPPLEFAVLAATHDVDLEAREQAFSLLARMKHPELPRLAREQLGDVDPEVRALGLQMLSGAAVSNDVPAAIALLGDPDPRVVVSAASLLRHVTGQDFGIRQAQAPPRFSGPAAQTPSPANLEIIRQGTERWQQWWTVHHAEYPASSTQNQRKLTTPSLAMPDVTLQDLSGHEVRLSAFQDKAVLLSFWEATNTLSLAELSSLNSLQTRLQQRLTILGICFTAPVLQDCGDHGDEHAGEHESGGAHAHKHECPAPDLVQVRTQIQEVVKAKQINYPVLLDEKEVLKGRDFVGQMPTYVLIDTQGNIRRRFIGSRTETVFAAMINELSANGE